MKPWERAQVEQPTAATASTPPVVPQPPTVPGVAPTPMGQVMGGAVAATSNVMLGSTLGPEIPGLTLGINACSEWVKNQPWFHEALTFPFVVLLSVTAAVAGWVFLQHDPFHAMTNALALIGNAHITYNGVKATGTGILKPTEEANRWAMVHGGA